MNTVGKLLSKSIICYCKPSVNMNKPIHTALMSLDGLFKHVHKGTVY